MGIRNGEGHLLHQHRITAGEFSPPSVTPPPTRRHVTPASLPLMNETGTIQESHLFFREESTRWLA